MLLKHLKMKMTNLMKNEDGGATTIVLILLLPVVMLLIFASIDEFLIGNIEEELQLQLNEAALAAAQSANDTKCVVNQYDIDFGLALFAKNDPVYIVDYQITDISSLEQREKGVVHLQLIANSNILFRNILLNKPYQTTYFIQATAVCNRYKD